MGVSLSYTDAFATHMAHITLEVDLLRTPSAVRLVRALEAARRRAGLFGFSRFVEKVQ